MATDEVYATIDELKAQPGVTGSGDDDVYTAMLVAASRSVDGVCNRQDLGFVASPTATARIFAGSGKEHQWIPEAAEVTLVGYKIDSTDSAYTSLSADDWLGFQGDPEEPDYNRLPYRGLLLTDSAPIDVWTAVDTRGPWRGLARTSIKKAQPTVQVTAKWGYALKIPALINQATITLAARWVKRGQSFWADVTSNSNQQQLMYRKMMDPDVKMMLIASRLVLATRP